MPFVNDAAPDVRGSIGDVAKVLELGALRRLTTAQDLPTERAGLKQQAMAAGLGDVQAEEAIAAVMGFANMAPGAGGAPPQQGQGQPQGQPGGGGFAGAPQATPIPAAPKKSNTVSIIVGLVVAVVGGSYIGQVLGLWDLRQLTGGGGGSYEAMPQPRMPDPQPRQPAQPQSDPMPRGAPPQAGGELPLIGGDQSPQPVVAGVRTDQFYLYQFLAPAGESRLRVIIGVNRQGWDAPGGILIRGPDGAERPQSVNEGRPFVAANEGNWSLRVYQAESFEPNDLGITGACVLFGTQNAQDVPLGGNSEMCLFGDSNCTALIGCAQVR